MYHPEIFLGDLIQEGNVGLILGTELVSDVETAHQTITEQIRQSMQMLIEEHTELSSRDKKMVEKVAMLDESIKTLTEELGRKVTIDELAVYMGMTEDDIEDILKLTGEDSDSDQ
jgi:DNA-directed RNA polymerase sigma subunit (sigma70/sigma32)